MLFNEIIVKRIYLIKKNCYYLIIIYRKRTNHHDQESSPNDSKNEGKHT